MRLVYLLMLTSLWACSGTTSEEPKTDPSDPSRILREANDDPTAAKVDGTTILRSELEERVQSQVEQFRRTGRSITPAFEHSTRVALLNHLIDRAVLSAEGKRLGLKVDESALKHHEAMFRERLGTEQAFEGYLARIGRDAAGWRTDQRQHLVQKLLFDRVLKVAAVSDEELLQRYKSQTQRYTQRRRLRLGEILKRVPSAKDQPDKSNRDSVRKRARGVIENLVRQLRKPGQRFSTIAKRVSDSPSKDRGGDIGWRVEERLDPGWMAQLKDAKKGAVIGPIESPDGMRLLKVIDVKEATQLSFEDVKVELRRTAEARARAQAERDLVKQLRAKANITILDRRLKSSGVPKTDSKVVK